MRTQKKTYNRKPWTKMISAEQFGAIMKEYDAGAHTSDLCEKYKVSRSWLYRERKRWIEGLNPRDDVTCLRAEIARLEQLLVGLLKDSRFARSEVLPKRKAS